MLQCFVHIGCVDVEPDNVCKPHIGRVKNGLKVVEGKLDLTAHVPGMLRFAVGVDGGLACTDQLPACSGQHFGLIVAEIQRPRPRVNSCSFNGLSVLIDDSRNPDNTGLLPTWWQE